MRALYVSASLHGYLVHAGCRCAPPQSPIPPPDEIDKIIQKFAGQRSLRSPRLAKTTRTIRPPRFRSSTKAAIPGGKWELVSDIIFEPKAADGASGSRAPIADAAADLAVAGRRAGSAQCAAVRSDLRTRSTTTTSAIWAVRTRTRSPATCSRSSRRRWSRQALLPGPDLGG